MGRDIKKEFLNDKITLGSAVDLHIEDLARKMIAEEDKELLTPTNLLLLGVYLHVYNR